MSERWRIGSYEFKINPNSYSEQYEMVGDTVTTINGTIISQPTFVDESYMISSIFFQPRPRILSEVATNGTNVCMANNRYYFYNQTDRKIRRYNTNLVLEATVTVAGTDSFVAFDVSGAVGSETYYMVTGDTTSAKLCLVNNTGVTSSYGTLMVGEQITGIKRYDTRYYVITKSGKIYRYNFGYVQIDRVDLPSVPTGGYLGYRGIDVTAGIATVSCVSFDNLTTIYQIDIANDGSVVNAFALEKNFNANDIVMVNGNFSLVTNDNTIVTTNGVTVLLDIYKLKKEVFDKGYLDMKDDMDVTRRVAVRDIKVDRNEGYLHKYAVSLSVVKVNRGNIR